MPVNVSEMDALRKRYGRKKGTSIYYGLESKGGSAFKKGLRTAGREGHTVANMAAYRKKKRRGRK